MKHGRPQAKDFPDDQVVLAIAKLRKPSESYSRYGLPFSWSWVMRWDLAAALNMPEKISLTKMAALARKGLIDCCACGCRGDIVLTEKGEARLAELTAPASTP